jgi:hypothetical protein
LRRRYLLLLLGLAIAARAQQPVEPRPFVLDLGGVKLTPGGFLDTIGMSRSATTTDSVSTGFGRIPLSDTPGESLGSLRNSRLDLKGQAGSGPLQFTGYLESDFLNFRPGQSVYRWRQYWGAVQVGKWQVMGGQAWSFLRPNRRGMASDTDLMNTDAVDPGYHVGLLGSRVRQVRLTRTLGDFQAGFAWETRGNFLVRGSVDKRWGHAEATAFTGRLGRRGVDVAAVVNLVPRLRFVAQEYWSKRAASEAMGVVPVGVNGLATLEGLEFQLRRNVEIYSYGGLVYAARSGGNRLVREWTVGGDYRVAMPAVLGSVLLSLEFSRVDRYVWTGQSGAMNYVMYRARYAFN